MVRRYDDLVAEHYPNQVITKGKQLKQIDEFHTEVALYVENPELRRESRHYYGPEELNKKVDEFLASFQEEQLS